MPHAARTSPNGTRPRFARPACAAIGLLLISAGCGDGSGSPGTTADDSIPDARSIRDARSRDAQSGDARAGRQGQSTPPAAPSAERTSGVWVDEDGQKWWRGPGGRSIPYDVFFENWEELAADTRKAGSPAATAESDGSQTEKAAAAGGSTVEQPSAADGAVEWNSVMPIAHLESEVKHIANFIREKMQTVGRYNGAYKQIRSYGATLAALAEILRRHPDAAAVSWKDDAPLVRMFGGDISDAAAGLGRRNYEATLKPFENFVSVLNRNQPAGVEPPPAEAEFADAAERTGLMQRMDAADKFLRLQANTEAAFQGDSEKVKHEARILAAIGTVVADASYDSSGEDEYKTAAAGLVKAALEMAAAAEDGRFDDFRKATDAVYQRCNDCHMYYR